MFAGQFLIPKEQNPVIEEGSVNRGKQIIRHGLGQIDAHDLRAQAVGKRTN
jgi:hypothetical protein